MSNNLFADATREIATSSGSYQVPNDSFADFSDPGLLIGDIFLLFISGVILLKTFADYSKNKSSSSASLPPNK